MNVVTSQMTGKKGMTLGNNPSALKTSFSEVAVGLVTRYACEPQSLSEEECKRVQDWMQQYTHVRKEVEEMRENSIFYKGASMTLSDV